MYQSTKANKVRARNKSDLIIEVWESLDCESVGALELEQVQIALSNKFGEGAVESPASIARTLADEGAILRHPEVLDFDTKWRDGNLSALISPDALNFSGLLEAAESINKLDVLRRRLEKKGEQLQLQRLREMALKLKQEAQTVERSSVVERQARLEAKEIVQWLTVWLHEPNLFADWLSLRRRSPEFLQIASSQNRER